MNMRTDIWKGIAAVGMLLLMGMNAQAQCPSTAMSVTQEAAGCGADVSFSVTNDIGFQSVQWTVDGEPFSSQQAGTVYFNPGTYVFEALTVDTDNCTSLMQEEVTVGLSAFISVQATPCAGQCTGSLMAVANGGTFPYDYIWPMGNTTQVVDGLCDGPYMVWVTDMNGCSAEATINLVEAPPTIEFLMDTLACYGNLQLDMNTTGGTGDYSFSWVPALLMNDPASEFPTVSVGNDTVTVTVTMTDNVTGCATTESVTVFPNVPQNQTVTLCSGSAELTLDPGSMVYNWTAEDPDGNPIDMSGVTGNSFTATELGIYTVMTYYSACNQVFHEFEVVVGLEVFLPDTVYTCSGVCAGTATAIATGGTPPYTYFWPTNAFTIAMNTSLCAGIGTVEVWDANGCMGSADVVVMEHPVQEFSIADSSSSFIMMNDVGYGICLWATPGFSPYVWSNGSMGQFICISHTPSSPMQDWLAYVMATDSLGCSYLDSFLFEFPFWGDDVWPGDVSYDGVANNTDMLYLGLSFGYSDFERLQASLDWTGQPSLDWNMFISGVNANPKHADTDGNGVVNFADTIAISQNYGQTHGKTENGLAGSYPALWVEAVQDTVAPGQGIHATVHLGSASQPVDSLHGIAFTLTFNDMLVDDAAFSIDFSGNALGTVGSDVMTLQKLFLPDGEVDVAVTRTTRQNWGGYGPLATFHIVTTDNLSGIHELRIGVSGITAITAREFPVELASVPDTVIIDPEHVGIGEAFGSSLRVWPNPGSGIFRIEGLHGAEMVEVMDATGRTISHRATDGPDALTIDLSEQPDGLYLLRLTGRDGVAVRRLVKTR